MCFSNSVPMSSIPLPDATLRWNNQESYRDLNISSRLKKTKFKGCITNPLNLANSYILTLLFFLFKVARKRITAHTRIPYLKLKITKG